MTLTVKTAAYFEYNKNAITISLGELEDKVPVLVMIPVFKHFQHGVGE